MLNKNNKTAIAFLAAIAGLLIVAVYIKDAVVKEPSPEVIAEKAISYIRENFLGPEMTASLVEVSDAGNVYRIRLQIEGMEFDSYASKDGTFFFPEGYDLREGFVLDEPQEPKGPQEPQDISSADMAVFVECLKEAGFVVYGADWCGWTTQLVTMLGGKEIIDSIYIECTKKEDLCREKEIMGYPTVLINGKQYAGERSFKGFSEATGCSAPAGSENQDAGNPAGGC